MRASVVLAAIALYPIMMDGQKYPSRDTVSVLSDGSLTELYVAVVEGRNREITTHQFFERRPDLGEVEFLKRVAWEVSVPQGGEPFIATGGRRRGELNAFWVGWRDAHSVSALSVFQEEPIRAVLEGGDQLVSQPIIMPNKKLYFYFWRGARLMRMEFSGELKQQGSVATVELSSERVAPSLSASRAMPGSAEDESLVGMVETGKDALEPGVLFVSGKNVRRVAGEPLPGYSPLSRQQLGMHVDAQGAVTIAFVAERHDSKGYALIEATCEPTAAACRVVTAPISGIGAGTLYSAAAFYYERRTSRELFVLLLETDGKLFEMRKGITRPIRTGVERSYSFPILTTVSARYEARFKDNDSVELVPIN